MRTSVGWARTIPPTMVATATLAPAPFRPLRNLPTAVSVSVEIVGRTVLGFGHTGTGCPVVGGCYDWVGGVNRTRFLIVFDLHPHLGQDRVHGADALVRGATADTQGTRRRVRVVCRRADDDRAIEFNIDRGAWWLPGAVEIGENLRDLRLGGRRPEIADIPVRLAYTGGHQ